MLPRTIEMRPVDPQTGAPVGPLAQPGYYPDFHTLDQQSYWDAKTRAVVIDRVDNVPPIRFFNGQQARTLTAICDRILPQDDRDEAHRIPIVPQIDRRLFEDIGDGYRWESKPSSRSRRRCTDETSPRSVRPIKSTFCARSTTEHPVPRTTSGCVCRSNDSGRCW
jgi:hypothetical protein